MKTPQRIVLFKDDVTERYNPITDTYEEQESEYVEVPCLINFINQSKTFQDYGNRTDYVMICRFMQEQEPFKKALYNEEYFIPLESINAPIKGAVRLKKVGKYG